MRKLALCAAALLLLTACAAEQAITTGKPIDPAQVKQDLQVTGEALQTVDCIVATAAPVASQIGAATGNQDAVNAANDAASISKPLCPKPAAAPQ